VCAQEFDRQLQTLSRWFTVLPLKEAVTRLRTGNLPARAACVTFDDGYADNHDVALPLLAARGIPATFFVATSFLEGGRMWNDDVIDTVRLAGADTLDAQAAGLGRLDISDVSKRRQGIDALIGALKYLPLAERRQRVEALAATNAVTLPAGSMMRPEQVKALHRAGMEIGAHTVSHPILAKLDSSSAMREIRASRETLEAILGATVTLFAYPNGKPHQDYSREHVEMVRELGFEAAVSTAWGVSRCGSDCFQLPRFCPWDRTPGKFALRLLHNTFRTRHELV
jgi:peptidoglycan/xylan/chitin deacetylase (PgdA/CDA1 family)